MKNNQLPSTNHQLISNIQFPISKPGYWLLVIGIYLVIGIWLLVIPAALADNLTESLLKSGIGVRPLAMGGAFTAVADDVNSVFYNPAGLARAPIFGYSSGDQDLNRQNTMNDGYALVNLGPAAYGAWSIKNLAGENADLSAYSFGGRGSRGILWGLTYKNVRWNLNSGSGLGWSSDIGLIINVMPEISLGILAQDLAQDKNLNVPASTRFGVAVKPWNELLVLAADAEIRGTKQEFSGHCGLEFTVSKGFKLRAGNDNGNFTAGVGFDLPLLSLNYAVVNQPNQTVQRFGINLAFGGQEDRPFALNKPKEFALITVGGKLTGGESEFSLFGGSQVGADTILRNIKRAVKDPGIDGIVLKITGFEGGMGSSGIVQELRAELKRAQKAGKKVVAYVESESFGDEYYLTSVADKIVAPPQAAVGGIGKSIEVSRLQGLFKKFGIEWQVLSKGKYKTAFVGFSSKMTPEQKEMVQSLVDDLYRGMVTDISESRGISIEAVKEIGDGQIFTVDEAKKQKLIDEIGYLSDATRLAAKLTGANETGELVEPDKLRPDIQEEILIPLPKIAVIAVDGDITTGHSGSNLLFGGKYTGSDTVCDQIKQARDDWSVRVIILRINSGGGSAVASPQIYQEIKKAREKGKIVIASLGDVAASGAYYIACGADKIIADPGTITGSIGVWNSIPVYAGLYKKLGIGVETFKEGKHADMFSGTRKLTAEERKSLENLLESTYQDFVKTVAEGRKISTREAEAAAQGRIYTGSQALDVKLIDKLGGFSDAVDEARNSMKIKAEPQIIYYLDQGFGIPLF